MKALMKGIMLAALLYLVACTNENEVAEGSNFSNNTNDNLHRELLLTFKNQLMLAGTQPLTKTSTPVATKPENTVSSLDVYVFASDNEAGPFTFQERFAYRNEEIDLPSGAAELELNPTSKENEYTALLSLQKGLFVKLYCIANQPSLVDPANEGAAVADAYFQPLIQTTPGQTGSKVKTAGIPTEAEFVSFHTPLLSAGVESDTLICPLPMSGSYTRPLDLTDYAVSSRMQAGFKLTRMVSRFDITNDADQSKFTIESVSLAKGRRGVDFFTMTPFSSTPADPAADLITYPDRAFFGDKANAGTQTGAFYCYPSPTDDDAYLILKGKYRINQTEQKEVSYNVPFKQMKADGTGSYIEITPNHRYTVAITNATEEGVQFTLDVTDWDEGNEVDDYEPENTPGKFQVTIPDAFKAITTIVSSNHVRMSLEANSMLTIISGTNSELSVSKSYLFGKNEYDWLEISAPAITSTKAAAFTYTYTVSLNPTYSKETYPRAIVSFKDKASGEISNFIIEAISKPAISKDGVSVPADDKIEDAPVSLITMYKLRDTECTMQIKVSSYGGSKLEYTGSGITLPAITESDESEAVYTLTATGIGTGSLKVMNKTDTSKSVEYAVQVIDPLIVLPSSSDLTLKLGLNETSGLTGISSGAGFTVNVTDWGTDGIAWFDFTSPSTIEEGTNKDITLKIKDNLMQLNPAKVKTATVTLTNNIAESNDTTFTVTPQWLDPTNGDGQQTTFSIFTINPTEIKINAPFGGLRAESSNETIATVSLNSSADLVTVTGKTIGSANLKVYNAQKTVSSAISYTVSIKKWATGNLVRTGANSCGIGNPTDRGLLFKWGSLVGYDANNTAANPTCVVKPAAYGSTPVFTASPATTGTTLTTNASQGIGDPCTFYLGNSWRMPTADEYRSSLGGGATGDFPSTHYAWVNNTGKLGPNKILTFSANGYLRESDGKLGGYNSWGCVWASTPDGTTKAYYLDFTTSKAYVPTYSHGYGYGIRCVQE